MEKIKYLGWPNCYRIKNSLVDMIVTTDVGPRIIRFGFIGQPNVMAEFPEMAGKTGGSEWLIYGGHRLWHAPESKPRSYFPDNAPVKIEEHTGFVRLTPPLETTTGIQKEIDIYFDPDEASVQVVHRLINNNLWDIELAPWALSVLATGGKAIIPLPPRGSHTENLTPSSLMSLWAYTDMADPRWTWGRKNIMLRQDPTKADPQKLGLMVPDGWAAYWNKGQLFVKTFEHMTDGIYPDFGCSVETFTNDQFLELETVAPLALLEPGESVEHIENWFLFRDVPEPRSDADVEQHIVPKIYE